MEEKAPLCECGCGEKVKWSKQFKRWNTYLKGHSRTDPFHWIAKFCECGCGQVVTPGRRFISGHNGRTDRYWKTQEKPTFCECGCGKLAKPGKRFIIGHATRGRKYSDEIRKRMSEAHKNPSKEIRNKISKAHKGKKLSKEHRIKISKALTGIKRSEKTRKKIANASRNVSDLTKKKRRITFNKNLKKNSLNIAIGRMKCRTDGYCDVWSDRQYRKDLRKFECENCGMSNDKHIEIYGCSLSNHHIDGNKKNCHPSNFRTLCKVCHAKDDWRLVRKGLVNR